MVFPEIIRITLTAILVVRKPHIKEILWNDILVMFRENEEYRKRFEEDTGTVVFDESFQMNEIVYESYWGLMIGKTEQIYTKFSRESFVNNVSDRPKGNILVLLFVYIISADCRMGGIREIAVPPVFWLGRYRLSKVLFL